MQMRYRVSFFAGAILASTLCGGVAWAQDPTRVDLPVCESGIEAPPASMIASCSMALSASNLDNSQKAMLLFIRGTFYLRAGNHFAAVSDFEQGLGLDPRNARLHRGRAITFMTEGNAEQALYHASASVEFAPDSSENLLVLGNVYERQFRNFEAALSAYNAAAAIDPEKASVRLLRMLNLQAQGRGGEAEKDGRWLISHPLSTTKHWGTFAYQGVQMPTAIAARLFYGGLLTSLRREEEAEALLTDLIATNPSPQSYLGRALYYAAHGLHKAPRMKDAARDAAAAVRLSPGYAIAWRKLALYQRNSSDPAGALNSLDAALALSDWDSNRPIMLWDRAIMLRNVSRSEEATSAAIKAVEFALLFGANTAADVVRPLRERGYWSGPLPNAMDENLKDAVAACIIDEGCE